MAASGTTTGVTELGPDDPGYRAIIDKQFNKRFRASPEHVRLADCTEQVVAALDDAVRAGRRLVVTSGGHCLEGFVSDPEVRVILDVSAMKRVYYDPDRRAVAIEAGATVGESFRALAEQWGVVVPLGEYPGIGMGGHVVGGAFGFLCRQLGLAADYLEAVEVVTVDDRGRACSVIASRDSSDANHDLWWAHTGGGGGNFGVVTRYWFRAPNATGNDPARLLPRAPESITTITAEWSWRDIDRSAFRRLLQNHGAWSERHSTPDGSHGSLWSLLEIHRQQFGTIYVRGSSTAGPNAEQELRDYLASLGDGIVAARVTELTRMPWLDFALNPFPALFAMPPGGVSVKVKDAMLARRLSDRQIDVAHDYLTSTEYDVIGGVLGMATYGGRVNAIAPNATAAAQRRTIFDMACNTGWIDPADASKNLDWVRRFYGDLFADTGGVPLPGDAYDGCFINHPDVDVLDPTLNRSGVPWHTLYYQSNYSRLQQVKVRWDPRNVFHHALSIRGSDSSAP